MILKIENDNNNGYCYHEADEIEFYSIKIKDFKEKSDAEGVTFYLKEQQKEEDNALCFTLYRNERSSFRMLISTRTTYLMNNEGKTIDRLL
jgi:hypothetical protein